MACKYGSVAAGLAVNGGQVSDPSVMFEMVKESMDIGLLKRASPALVESAEFMLKMVRVFGVHVLAHAGQGLRSDMGFFTRATWEHGKDAQAVLGEGNRTKGVAERIAQIAAEDGRLALRYAAPMIRSQIETIIGS
ncbi:MAG: hypothetical protein S4CHLAM102_06660 [Chlamydiia bacterium]|nr:hypothetical protein [Chlamydiia bacterium]